MCLSAGMSGTLDDIVVCTIATVLDAGSDLENEKPTRDLKPPLTSATPEVPVQLPPLTLGNPEIVAKHTACTLHPQALPPNLAIKLFETILNEAERWDRNRFWFFERAVESPHKNMFYVRDMSVVAGYGPKGDISDMEWKEAAHYWYVLPALGTT